MAGEASVPYKGKKAHEKCFNIAIKTLQKDKTEKLEEKQKKTKRTSKPKAELKDAMSEEEYQEKQQYYQYLRRLTGDELSAKIYALTEDYMKRYGFTFKSMYLTLVYLNEIICKDLTGDVVGIIPYYHTEAEKYYESIQKIEDSTKDVDVSKFYQEKTIMIKPKKRKVKQLDISSIGSGDD